MIEQFLSGRVTLHCGDCLAALPTLAENSFDSCVTDPPYHLTNNVGSRSPLPGQYTPIGQPKQPKGGFMGKTWDGGDVAFRPETWAEVYRVLKPGAHLLTFGGTRTFHRMACAIEDAGFEVRDTIMWVYGSGFPKSHDVSKAIDKAAGASQWEGWGTALKPAVEPIILARKPLSERTVAANVLKWGTGALNIGECRVAATPDDAAGVAARNGRCERDNEDRVAFGKHDRNGSTRSNVDQGRWPANLIHDGSEEVVAAFPASGGLGTGEQKVSGGSGLGFFNGGQSKYRDGMRDFGDSGSAARFFYTAKADFDDRLGSKHPTVKPLDLMQYLVRLVTPKGGVILDLFAGTGTTGEAAIREGVLAVLIEREADYQADIRRRMQLVMAGPNERLYSAVKARCLVEDPGPLFAIREAAE